MNMVRRPDEITALIMACHDEKPEIVKKLLKNDKINLNSQDIYGNTAAMVSVISGSFNCLRLLSEDKDHEVDWNLGDDVRDDSAAILAVRMDNFEAIKILVENKSVNWSRKNRENETAFSLALKNDNKEVVKLILNNVSNLDLDIEHLKSQNVFATAVEICQQFIAQKVADLTDGESVLIMVSKLIKANVIDESLPKKRFRLVFEDVLECPVCFEAFSNEAKVFQCSEGHFTCGKCKPKLEYCPECRSMFMGRAIGFERTLH